jgi:hypothetical protein
MRLNFNTAPVDTIIAIRAAAVAALGYSAIMATWYSPDAVKLIDSIFPPMLSIAFLAAASRAFAVSFSLACSHAEIRSRPRYGRRPRDGSIRSAWSARPLCVIPATGKDCLGGVAVKLAGLGDIFALLRGHLRWGHQVRRAGQRFSARSRPRFACLLRASLALI